MNPGNTFQKENIMSNQNGKYFNFPNQMPKMGIPQQNLPNPQQQQQQEMNQNIHQQQQQQINYQKNQLNQMTMDKNPQMQYSNQQGNFNKTNYFPQQIPIQQNQQYQLNYQMMTQQQQLQPQIQQQPQQLQQQQPPQQLQSQLQQLQLQQQLQKQQLQQQLQLQQQQHFQQQQQQLQQQQLQQQPQQQMYNQNLQNAQYMMNIMNTNSPRTQTNTNPQMNRVIPNQYTMAQLQQQQQQKNILSFPLQQQMINNHSPRGPAITMPNMQNSPSMNPSANQNTSVPLIQISNENGPTPICNPMASNLSNSNSPLSANQNYPTGYSITLSNSGQNSPNKDIVMRPVQQNYMSNNPPSISSNIISIPQNSYGYASPLRQNSPIMNGMGQHSPIQVMNPQQMQRPISPSIPGSFSTMTGSPNRNGTIFQNTMPMMVNQSKALEYRQQQIDQQVAMNKSNGNISMNNSPRPNIVNIPTLGNQMGMHNMGNMMSMQNMSNMNNMQNINNMNMMNQMNNMSNMAQMNNPMNKPKLQHMNSLPNSDRLNQISNLQNNHNMTNIPTMPIQGMNTIPSIPGMNSNAINTMAYMNNLRNQNQTQRPSIPPKTAPSNTFKHNITVGTNFKKKDMKNPPVGKYIKSDKYVNKSFFNSSSSLITDLASQDKFIISNKLPLFNHIKENNMPLMYLKLLLPDKSEKIIELKHNDDPLERITKELRSISTITPEMLDILILKIYNTLKDTNTILNNPLSGNERKMMRNARQYYSNKKEETKENEYDDENNGNEIDCCHISFDDRNMTKVTKMLMKDNCEEEINKLNITY